MLTEVNIAETLREGLSVLPANGGMFRLHRALVNRCVVKVSWCYLSYLIVEIYSPCYIVLYSAPI